MTQDENARLRQTILDVVSKIRRFQDRTLGEQNTKASLIEPILEALGWDIRDPDEVHREFRPTPKDCPVDYALKLLRKPRLFVEAKGLGESLADRKWITQVLGYAVVAGVEWCVLSDGDEYRFYNATAAVDADEKLFCRIRLSEDQTDIAVQTLNLISRKNMEENILDVLWKAHFVDRHVKRSLQEMFAGADKGLVRLLRHRSPKLSPKEIMESLRRLDLHVESLTPLPDSPAAPPAIAPRRRKESAVPKKEKHAYVGVRLSEVVAAGVISPPVKLFRKYKGKVLEATLVPDGTVEFQGECYKTCSLAADMARGSVTGRRMNTNGWVFWQYVDAGGATRTLDDARRTYLKQKSKDS